MNVLTSPSNSRFLGLRRRQTLTLSCMVLQLIVSLLTFIPDVHAQTYDHYEWYGTTGQGDTNVNISYTCINNETVDYIGHNGWLVAFQTYFGAGCNGNFRLKIARATGNPQEYNIYWNGTLRAQVSGMQNYTVSPHVYVQANDTIGLYLTTGVGNIYLCQRLRAGANFYYESGDLWGIQTINDGTAGGRSLTVRVRIGWDDAPSGQTFGQMMYHGFGLVGIGLWVAGGINLAMTIRGGDTQESMRAVGIAFLLFILGWGLFYTWITYA